MKYHEGQGHGENCNYFLELKILNDAYNLHLIILPWVAGAILGFLWHLGEGFFGHISSHVSTLVSAKVGVREGQLNITSKEKVLLFY